MLKIDTNKQLFSCITRLCWIILVVSAVGGHTVSDWVGLGNTEESLKDFVISVLLLLYIPSVVLSFITVKILKLILQR